MDPLELIDGWSVERVAAAIVRPDRPVETRGDEITVFRLASLSKMMTSWAVLVAVEEGSIELDAPVGQPGCTLRHLLSHAGGYGFDGDAPISPPQRRRIYSNTGIELAAAAVADATGIDFATYVAEAVFDPLGMATAELRGSPAHAAWARLDDVVRFAGELLRPTLISVATAAEATTPQFANLDGMVPGVGTFRPCPWGLGFEIHGDKQPHWMAPANSPATFGHFGGSGTMLWVDPVAEVAVTALTDRMFDEWAAEALRVWPELGAAVLAAS